MNRLPLLAITVALAAASGFAAPSRRRGPRLSPTSVPGEAPASAAVRGPLDVPRLAGERRITVRHSPLVTGNLGPAWDGNRFTGVEFACTPGKPAFVEFQLDRQRPIDEVNLLLDPTTPGTWSLTAAASAADLAAKRGSFHTLVPRRTAPAIGDQATFPTPAAYRFFRLELQPVRSENLVRLNECELWTPQTLSRLQADAFVAEAAVGQVLPIRADGWYDGDARQNVSTQVTWEISPPGAGTVDGLGRFVPTRPGPADLIACLGTLRSAPLRVEVARTGLPDWDVTYIERQPRVPRDGTEPPLAIGQSIYWYAHVRNYGTATAEPVPVEWRVDGEVVRSGRLPRMERFGLTEVVLTTHWDGRRHRVELVIDPSNAAAEVSKANNRLAVLTDARPVGFWVEDSTVCYFHRHQKELGVGSNSWEDWAQRQVAAWNDFLEKSAWLWKSPQEAEERWRLDRITQVGDGMLPLAGGSPTDEPDRRDRTVELSCGFPAYDPIKSPLYRETRSAKKDNPFFCQSALITTVARARRKPAISTPPVTRAQSGG